MSRGPFSPCGRRWREAPDEGSLSAGDRPLIRPRRFASRPPSPIRGEGKSKPRRALFRKRLDAFLDLGAAHALPMAAVVRRFIQTAMGTLGHGALHRAPPDRPVARHCGCPLIGYT